MSRLRRRKWIMTAAIALALALLVIGGFLRGRHNRIRPLDENTKQALQNTIIPHFKLLNATHDQVVDALNQSVQQSNLRGQVKFAWWRGPKLPLGYHPIRRPIPTEEFKHKPDEVITLALSDIPMIETLRYISNLLGCEAIQNDGTIYLIQPIGTFGPMQEHTYILSPSIFGPAATVDAQEIENFLHGNGVIFYEGTGVILGKSGKTFVVRNTQEQLDLCDQMFTSSPPTLFERITAWGRYHWDALLLRFFQP